MRTAILVLAVFALVASASAAPAPEGAPATVVVVVRHAEAGDAHGGDPGLTEAGRARAQALAELLGDAGVSRLFASEYRRTRETLEPLAAKLGVDVTVVPASATERLVAALGDLPAGTRAVVAGHSNTIPAIVRELGGTVAGTRATEHGEAIDSAAYDRLFVVVLGTAPQSLELRYGP